MAVGFRVPRRSAVIEFEGTDYDGASIKCALDVSLDMLLWFQKRQGTEDADQLREAFLRFGDEIVTSWNLLGDGDEPLPATGEGFLGLPPAFGMLILNKWTEAVAAVPAPLVEPSRDGSTSEVESTIAAGQ